MPIRPHWVLCITASYAYVHAVRSATQAVPPTVYVWWLTKERDIAIAIVMDMLATVTFLGLSCEVHDSQYISCAQLHAHVHNVYAYIAIVYFHLTQLKSCFHCLHAYGFCHPCCFADSASSTCTPVQLTIGCGASLSTAHLKTLKMSEIACPA